MHTPTRTPMQVHQHTPERTRPSSPRVAFKPGAGIVLMSPSSPPGRTSWKPNHQPFANHQVLDVVLSPCTSARSSLNFSSSADPVSSFSHGSYGYAVSRQGCIQRLPLVWQPSGSDFFPVAWHDSQQLREPLKSPKLVPCLRPKSAAVPRAQSPHQSPPRLRAYHEAPLRDSERAWLFAVHDQSLARARNGHARYAEDHTHGHVFSVHHPGRISATRN
jgi:hypothetical protein